MIEDARIADAATVAESMTGEDDRSMRLVEWGLAALALLVAFGLAFFR